MSDFETILRIIAEGIAIVFIPIGALAALAAIRLIWKKGSAMSVDKRDDEIAQLRARVDELERRGLISGEYDAQLARLDEIENRLDFAERLLAERKALPLRPQVEMPSPPNGSSLQ
ncbi:MAG: hypothetical protein ACREL5_07290 [Gemmatimonadales bacterium]